MKQVAKLFLLVIALIGCSDEPHSWPNQAFTASEWARTAEAGRYVFARDLVDSHALVGKPVGDVKQLLGPPSSDNSADHYFTYVIKAGGSGFNQIYVLDIRINPTSGVVESARVRGD